MPGKAQTSVVEGERKIDLKIGIRDFGPISSGEIALKPLTVFIGPNNSGKSYAAMLIRSILESYAMRGIYYGMPVFTELGFRVDPAEIPEFRRQVDNLEEMAAVSPGMMRVILPVLPLEMDWRTRVFMLSIAIRTV